MLPGDRNRWSRGWTEFWQCSCGARLRQYLLWRTYRRTELLSVDHGARRDGMRGRGQPQRRIVLLQRAAYSVAIGIVALAVCIGCRRQTPMAPDAVYAGIENELAAGELTKAREEAKAANDFFALKQPEWAAVFRIELGKVLIYQGESARALTLLQQPLPQSSSTDSQVMRDIFLSIAEARLDHLDEAEQTLRQVELHCSACALRSEIYSTRGSLELEKNNLDDAERAFRAALAGSRSHEDKFLQTRCLMNLAVIAMREENYEDSIASFS